MPPKPRRSWTSAPASPTGRRVSPNTGLMGPPRSCLPGIGTCSHQFVADRDHHGAKERGVDLDVKMLFALTNSIFDAGICCWDSKRAFDSVRPITALRYLYRGQKVLAWGGPYQGPQLIDGETWFPYQPTTFPTPPFAEFTSGHSTFSATGAHILKRFTRSNRFGHSVTFPFGSSRTEPGAVPAEDVTLSWKTFSDAADEAGMSRRFGGIHFEQADLDARSMGKPIGSRRGKRRSRTLTGAPEHTPMRCRARVCNRSDRGPAIAYE
jgi:vanadium-dependent haloperoxidase-like protein